MKTAREGQAPGNAGKKGVLVEVNELQQEVERCASSFLLVVSQTEREIALDALVTAIRNWAAAEK